MKHKLNLSEAEAQEELGRVKKLHKEALERSQEENEENLERVKNKLVQEVETASTVFQHTKNYQDVVTRIDSAVEQISSISGKVVRIHNDDEEGREVHVKQREEHVRRLQERLENELSDLQFEKEKVHKLLENLEITVKDRQKSVEKEQWQLSDKMSKFDIEKSTFEENKQDVLAKVDKERSDLQEEKNEFLREQEFLLRKILAEQERLQQERLSFEIQKDSDLQKIKQQALLLDSQIREAEGAKLRAQKTVEDYDTKHRRLLELEQGLKDEMLEIQSNKFQLEQEQQSLKIRAGELDLKEAELRSLRTEASKLSVSEIGKWEAQKLELVRRNIMLKEKAAEIVEKQRDLILQQEKLHTERETLERLKFETQQQKCFTCVNGKLDDVPEHEEVTNGNFTSIHAAEKPFDSPSFSRKGSMRSRLRNHSKELERFLKTERFFLQSLDHAK